jgi:hypothetical protein
MDPSVDKFDSVGLLDWIVCFNRFRAFLVSLKSRRKGLTERENIRLGRIPLQTSDYRAKKRRCFCLRQSYCATP